jgi:uncharacterized membrane protein (DUF106 family)
VATLNQILRTIFDLILAPFAGLPALVGLSLVSLVTAVGMLLVFKATSNQEQLAAVKRRIHSCLFEMRLFNDDLRAIMRAQLEVLRHNVTYIRLSLVPLLWMIIPLTLVLAQFQFHYAYEGIHPGQETLVKVELTEDWAEVLGVSGEAAGRPPVSLEVPEGLRVETSAVWLPALREIDWQITAEERGDYEIEVRVGEETYGKSVVVADSLQRRSPFRLARGFWNQLLYPAEDPLPASAPIESITVGYPDAEVSLLGWGLHWIIVFFVLSIVFAFALRNRFGVTI